MVVHFFLNVTRTLDLLIEGEAHLDLVQSPGIIILILITRLSAVNNKTELYAGKKKLD